MRLVGLTGPAGCGKDTSGALLSYHHGWRTYALAWPIRRALTAMFGWPDTAWQDREWKETPVAPYGVSPRRMAQTLGTEWGRDLINPQLWLLRAEQAIDFAAECGVPGVVITDVRFENEAAWIRRRGGVVVHVHRPGLRAVESHSSEAGVALQLQDPVVVNDSSIAQLHECLSFVLGLTPASPGR